MNTVSNDNNHGGSKKTILVLARRDHIEAMRVAAGLTIFGHQVRLIFMARPITEDVANSEHAELLELSDIAPETTLKQMADDLPYLDSAALAGAIRNSDGVINI